MTPGNPVVGGTVLRRAAIQSPNFVTTVSGWSINADGTAEFNSLTIRGNLTDVTSLSYSSTPAAGNLVASDGFTAATTDSFGNHIVPGHATYASGFAASVQAGFVQFYTGSLAAGWSASATIETDAFGDILLLASAGRSVSTGSVTVDDGGGNMSATSLTVTSLTVNGSTNTGVGNNGGVTSGPSGTVNAFPAAGPNHTHAEIHTHPL